MRGKKKHAYAEKKSTSRGDVGVAKRGRLKKAGGRDEARKREKPSLVTGGRLETTQGEKKKNLDTWPVQGIPASK